jgi:hypothetical protein
MTTMSGVKTEVTLYVVDQVNCPNNVAGNDRNVLKASSYSSNLISQIVTKTGASPTDCVVESTFVATGINKKLAGKTVSITGKGLLDTAITAKGNIDWVCATNADVSVVPKSCI